MLNIYGPYTRDILLNVNIKISGKIIKCAQFKLIQIVLVAQCTAYAGPEYCVPCHEFEFHLHASEKFLGD